MTQVFITLTGSFYATHSHGGTLAEGEHSHEFDYEVTFHGPLNSEDYLLDFQRIEPILKGLITTPLNNTNLSVRFKNPTTETLAVWIYNTVNAQIPFLYSVKVSEGKTRWAEYRGEK